MAYQGRAWRAHLSGLAMAIWLAAAAGCTKSDRPPLGVVHGRVTFDGKPLEAAYVVFNPAEGGRQSLGETDRDGTFQLKYIRDIPGAKIGAHKVVVITRSEGRRESLPACYSDLTQTELRADVVAGENEIDFPLKSRSSKATERLAR
jgi:hypothetical protein